jgi:hypothetical protein
MESSVQSQEQQNDNEKRIKFLIQLGKESYKNHNKKANTAITISGFLITVNGIFILANMNLIQFAFSNNNLILHPKSFLIVSIISMLLSAISIFESIYFIHSINPSSHDLSPFSDLIKPMSYVDLLALESKTIFSVSQQNERQYQNSWNKYYKWSLIALAGSIGALLASIAIIILNLFGI